MSERLYHAVGNGWENGQPVYSLVDLHDGDLDAIAAAWKWDGDPIDIDMVSLTANLDEARSIADDFGLTRILVIDAEALWISGANSEGYPITNRIDTSAIVEVIEL